MLDSDLATLYGAETKRLNRAVRRNPGRFPGDFMFQQTREEADALRYQIGTSKKGRVRGDTFPTFLTQEGIAMLSSVLNSPRHRRRYSYNARLHPAAPNGSLCR